MLTHFSKKERENELTYLYFISSFVLHVGNPEESIKGNISAECPCFADGSPWGSPLSMLATQAADAGAGGSCLMADVPSMTPHQLLLQKNSIP